MTRIVKVPKKKLRPPDDDEEVIEISYQQSKDDPWGPDRLYRRGRDGRRITFLELIAWAIVQAESCETRGEAEAFAEELKRTRKDVWGSRPWKDGTDDAAFRDHVLAMANVFANSDSRGGVSYPGRKTVPVPA